MCPRPPKMKSLNNIQLLPKLVASHTLEGFISSINHHKVRRNSFIIIRGIEVTKCFLGQLWT